MANGLTKKQQRTLDFNIQQAKNYIDRIYGHDTIIDARGRLCFRCLARCNHLLYPITTQGLDCPYFEVKGVDA